MGCVFMPVGTWRGVSSRFRSHGCPSYHPQGPRDGHGYGDALQTLHILGPVMSARRSKEELWREHRRCLSPACLHCSGLTPCTTLANDHIPNAGRAGCGIEPRGAPRGDRWREYARRAATPPSWAITRFANRPNPRAGRPRIVHGLVDGFPQRSMSLKPAHQDVCKNGMGKTPAEGPPATLRHCDMAQRQRRAHCSSGSDWERIARTRFLSSDTDSRPSKSYSHRVDMLPSRYRPLGIGCNQFCKCECVQGFMSSSRRKGHIPRFAPVLMLTAHFHFECLISGVRPTASSCNLGSHPVPYTAVPLHQCAAPLASSQQPKSFLSPPYQSPR